jgi:uncharacterized protein
MMMRLLFWLALAVLVVFAIRAKVRSAAAQAQAHAQAQAREGRREIAAESMTSCAHCGLHFPVSEAIRADGRDYCSPAHVRLPPV